MRNLRQPLIKRRQSMVVAMVLGTALTALAPSAAVAQSADPAAIADISRYCTTCWRNARINPDNWSDCTQDVLIRLLERVTPAAWDRVLAADGDERREFIRAIDAVKKRNQRSRKYAELQPELVADRPVNQALADDRALVDRAAEEALTPRQQQILRMSFEGWSVDELSRELGIGPERVSDEKYKAIRKLREQLAKEDVG
jgi:RNA polymerase sigma factor (sigma-70 family)